MAGKRIDDYIADEIEGYKDLIAELEAENDWLQEKLDEWISAAEIPSEKVPSEDRKLEAENARLRDSQEDCAALLAEIKLLEAENARLRRILTAPHEYVELLEAVYRAAANIKNGDWSTPDFQELRRTVQDVYIAECEAREGGGEVDG